MIVHKDGSYETGYWLTSETYPESYFINDQDQLAAKVVDLYPYYKLIVVDGILVDVEPREKTQEEKDAEAIKNAPTPTQSRINALETDNLNLTVSLNVLQVESDKKIEQANNDSLNNMIALAELYEMNLWLQERLDLLEGGTDDGTSVL